MHVVFKNCKFKKKKDFKKIKKKKLKLNQIYGIMECCDFAIFEIILVYWIKMTKNTLKQ